MMLRKNSPASGPASRPRLGAGLRAGALALVAGLSLTACTGTQQLFTVPVPPEAAAIKKVPSRYGTIVVNQVSLPDYAAAEGIAMRQPDGSVEASRDLLWADLPQRAMTLEVARFLTQITGSKVASEPWPFFDRPAASVEIRLEQMLAENNNTFHLTGQYYVSPDNGGGRSGMIDIIVPMDASLGARGIAEARSAATLRLAQQIAAQSLR